jgi:hypothetical protein
MCIPAGHRTQTRRKPLSGGSVAPSLARKVCLTVPARYLMASFETRKVRTG